MSDDNLYSRFDLETFEADMKAAEAAETPEEKLIILERCFPHDEAVCVLERILDPSLPLGCVTLHDAPDEAVTRR
jgi:hypothetical protein